MATVAVFIAFAGSSYAALKVTSRDVPKDALTGADIKNLTGKDVTSNSLAGTDVENLTSDDVTNGKPLAEDFAPGQLPRGERGDSGAPGSALAYGYVKANGDLDRSRSEQRTIAVTVSTESSFCPNFEEDIFFHVAGPNGVDMDGQLAFIVA